MKRFMLFLTTLLSGMGGLADSAQAYLLDEKQLFTNKKGCYINYLTEKNTSGWYIETNREECDENGFLSGYHNITVYNGFSKPVEYLSGYFSNGYWTGNDFIKNPEFKRFSDELGVQKATFALKENKQDDIRYIAQIVTKKTKTGSYPAFKVCNPIRVMGIHAHKADFKDMQFMQRIFNHVATEVRFVCPKEEQVMLFLSEKENPKQEDIAVFVKMDLKTRKHRILYADEVNKAPVPKYVKQEKSKTVSVVISQKNNHFVKNENMKSVFQEDKTPNWSPYSDTVDDVKTDSKPVLSLYQRDNEPSLTKASDFSQKEDSFNQKNEAGFSKTTENQNDAPEAVIEEADTIALKAASYFNSSSDYTSPEAETFQVPTPKKSYLQPIGKRDMLSRIDKKTARAAVTDISASVWPVQHIFLTSKVLDTPVLAKAAIRIDQISMDNTSMAEQPVLMDVEGMNLHSGWQIVKGYFIAYKGNKDDSSVGAVRILQTETCGLSICNEGKK